jgi:hypothetical protein
MNIKTYTNYPARIVILTSLFSVSVYLTGSLLLYPAGEIWVIMYLCYCLLMEIRLIAFHCPNCYYQGRVCAFGKGWISSLFFKPGVPEKFTCKTYRWNDMIPDLLVFLIPAVTGIISLLASFNWIHLILILLFALLNFQGNAFIRGKFACNHCIQAGLGCPALELFNARKE